MGCWDEVEKEMLGSEEGSYLWKFLRAALLGPSEVWNNSSYDLIFP